MDPRLLVLAIPIVAIMCITVIKLARIKTEQLTGGATPDVLARLEHAEAEITALRHELEETQERLDFTERLLARGTDGAGTSQ